MTETTLSLVRHGEVHNPNCIYYGRLPGYALSTLGRQQAEAAANVFAEANAFASATPFASANSFAAAALFSSPLLRARQTAEIILSRLPGIDLRMQLSSLLIEVGSPFDGLPRDELIRRNWDVYTGSQLPYEQPTDVLSRVLKFVGLVRRRYPGQHVIAVTHGDPIQFLAQWAKDQAVGPMNEDLPYPGPASISTFIFSEAAGSSALEGKPVYRYFDPARKR